MPKSNKLLAFALLTVGAAATIESDAAGDTPLLLVANRSSHEITFVDLTNDRVVARTETGAGPHLLSNVSEGLVAATGYGEFPRPHKRPVAKRPPFESKPNSRLTVVDIESRAVKLDTEIAGCARPHASWIIDRSVYVTCEDERQLSIVDLENGSVQGRMDTEQSGTHVLSYDPGSQTLAASNTGSGSLTLFHLGSSDSTIVPLTSGSEGALAVSGMIWVGNTGDGSVSVVDPATGEVVETIADVCGFPIAFTVSTDSNIWLACFGSSEVLAFDSQTRAIVQRISLDEQPLNVLAHPTAERLYVSYPRQNAIGEIDLRTKQERRRINVGIEPDGLRWAN